LHHVFLISQSTSLGGFAKLNVYSQENDPNLLQQDCICSVSPFDTKLAPFPLAHQHRTKQNQFQLQAELPTNTHTKTENLTPVEQERLSQTFGGFTVKQRLREEVESPFRKVGLVFFGSSAGSALVALYFSATNVLKANMGGYSDAMHCLWTRR
jgi:hypothetical protein